ncbi:SUKH-3 domain-containing protein [Streptomyces sp. NPDC096311]|uniref:SUKH-3 domain-containing protein n=1 Tax=Streptomyces sp. NPDC096311 TaxID=3366083 RepID=UPI0037FF4539
MGPIDPAVGDVELLDFLRRIEWFPGRQSDLRPHLEAWTTHDYRVSDAVQDFMAECGDLGFEYPRHPAVGGSHTCLVSGTVSAPRIARRLVASYETRIDRELCPIGQSASGNLFLLMASDGTTYGGHDQFLAKISDDGYHALLDISRREKMIPI